MGEVGASEGLRGISDPYGPEGLTPYVTRAKTTTTRRFLRHWSLYSTLKNMFILIFISLLKGGLYV